MITGHGPANSSVRPSTTAARFAAMLVNSHLDRDFSPVSTSGSAALSPVDVLDVQTLVTQQLGARVAGWKVSKRSRFETVFAPIYRARTSRSPTPYFSSATTPIRIEIEVALLLAQEPHDEALVIDEMVFGIEIIRSRLANSDTAPFWAFHGDNLGNDGYVLLRVPFRDALAQSDLQVRLDRSIIWSGSVRHPLGDPKSAMLLLMPLVMHHLGGLQASQFITTGNLCPFPFTISSSTEVTVLVDGLSDSVDIVLQGVREC